MYVEAASGWKDRPAGCLSGDASTRERTSSTFTPTNASTAARANRSVRLRPSSGRGRSTDQVAYIEKNKEVFNSDTPPGRPKR